MKVNDIIRELSKCEGDLEIAVFDEKSRPYHVDRIVVDENVYGDRKGLFSAIIIESESE